MNILTGKYRGLSLWYDDFDNDTQYQMKIWRNFTGFTYRKLVHDKVIYTKVVRVSYSSLDYQTCFVFLRSHFGL